MPDHSAIRQRVEQLRQAGATADDIEKYVRAASSVPDTTTTTEASVPQEDKSSAGDFLAPIASGLTMGFAPKILGAIEGANTVMHGGSFSEGYTRGNEATRQAGNRFSAKHPVGSAALEIGASIPTILATGGAGAVGEAAEISRAARLAKIAAQGAKYGALGGIAKTEGSPSDYAKGAVTGGLLGAATAPLVSGIAGMAGNLANRTGLTDKIASGVERFSPKAAAALGTRGQVNRALTGRQDVLDALGAKAETPAAQQMSRIAATKSKAGKLYGIARQDKRILDDPELQTLLNDPQVKQAYQAASEIREASGSPLPRVKAPEHAPNALQKMGVSPERYAELMKLNQSRRVPVVTGTDILSPELQGELTNGVSMPDPDLLSKVKQYLYDAANGLTQNPLMFKKDQARALIPKIDAIRQKLHDLSPEWKAADAFYADAKGQEEAFEKGFDAFRNAASPVGEKLPTHSVEAMLQEIRQPRYANEPVEAMQSRANAFREGVKAATQEQVRGAPVDKGLTSILGGSTLAPTEKAAQVRSLMFNNPSEAQKAEMVLAVKRGKAMQTPSPMNTNGVPYPSRHGVLRAAVTPFTEPDLINSVKGQGLLAQRLASPDLRGKEIDLFRNGSPLTGNLAKLLGITLSSQVTR